MPISTDLFSPLDPARPERPTIIGGETESAERLGDSFLEAADQLAAVWKQERARGHELEVALPIIQTYRHAIELILKAQCINVRDVLQWGLKMGYGKNTEPPNMESKLYATHSIARLANVLVQLLGGLSVGDGSEQLPADVKETLTYLHRLDERGTAFRYSVQLVKDSEPPTWVPVRPEPTPIHLGSAIDRLRNAASLLSVGLGGYLDHYRQWLQEMWTEYQSNLSVYDQ